MDIPEKMRMVSIPVRNWSAASGGLGVVGREGIGVELAERDTPTWVSFSSGRRMKTEWGGI